MNNKESSYENKSKKVREHLKEKGSITIWEAIRLYGATRLSGIIFDFRNYLKRSNSEYEIKTLKINNTDRNGKRCNYGKYIYVKKENKNEQDFHSLPNNKNLTQNKKLM